MSLREGLGPNARENRSDARRRGAATETYPHGYFAGRSDEPTPQTIILACVMCVVLLIGLLGCGGGQNGAPKSQDPQVRAQELIDSGNSAYRAGQYSVAAKRYAAAAVEKKDDPAAYYGMGMALAKLGQDEEARRAYAKARELAQAQAKAKETEGR